MKRAVYAGSFDPLTRGHLWMIQEGTRLFDELVVAIGISPDKEHTFSINERLEMLQETTSQFPNVKVDSYEGKLLVDYARAVGAGYLLRGVRVIVDFEYERMIRYVNADLCTDIQTVFLIPPREIADISSSLVRSIMGTDRWQEVISKYVPDPVYQKLIKRGS
jgi:pantetheine-phosphate adenylyltransferase